MQTVRVGGRLWYVVRHDHVLVADLFVDLHRFDEVDVAFIGEGFDEVIAVAADVAEVDVEDLVARAEVTDDVEDLFSGIGEHFGDRALAEVEAVVGALLDRDEALQAIEVPSTRWSP